MNTKSPPAWVIYLLYGLFLLAFVWLWPMAQDATYRPYYDPRPDVDPGWEADPR